MATVFKKWPDVYGGLVKAAGLPAWAKRAGIHLNHLKITARGVSAVLDAEILSIA